MRNQMKKLLFIVDDDAFYLKSLELEILQSSEYEIRTFPTGELCIENLLLNPDVIVLDYYLNGVDKYAINGLETLDRIRNIDPLIPIIMLSCQDKIEVAVNCMKHKAYDYIVKSETASLRLQKTIRSIFKNIQQEKTLNWYMEMM